jgi:AcrR family transcriptional regulator
MSTKKTEPQLEHRPPGRPRSATAEEAILRATIELIAEGGLGAATIQAVADRSGVARATIYLRWSGHEALIEAALRHAIGREPVTLSGNIEADLHRSGRQTLAILSEPLFVKVLPALIPAFLRTDPGPDELTFHLLFPGRLGMADEYRNLAAEQGFRTDIDGEVATDIILGALLFELLATGKPPTRDRADQVVDVAIAGLRRTG